MWCYYYVYDNDIIQFSISLCLSFSKTPKKISLHQVSEIVMISIWFSKIYPQKPPLKDRKNVYNIFFFFCMNYVVKMITFLTYILR